MLANPDLYRAVVRLTNTYGLDQRQSIGSGILFTSTGLIVTNNHVIHDPSLGTAFGEITVESLEGVDRPAANAIPAEVIIRNEHLDLAVLKVTGPAPQFFIDLIQVPNIDASVMERRIRVLGYPPLGGATITVTRGIASGFDEAGNLKTDAEINPGNSGGAALDDLDTFLGIPSFMATSEAGKLGFIISADRIKAWFAVILKSGLPNTMHELAAAFVGSNLKFSKDNLTTEPSYPRILGKFAAVETLLANGEYEKALPHIKFILDQKPRSALAYNYLGKALLGLGRCIEAMNAFRTCLAHDPSAIPALGNLGVTLIHLDRRNEALQIFEQIIDLSDNPAELWGSYHNIAKLYADWGKPAASEMYQAKANELKAAADEALANYKPAKDPRDVVNRIAEAIVKTEIDMEEQHN